MLAARLASLRPALASGPRAPHRVTLATGNESGDMDSVVCAIVHSIFSNSYKTATQEQRLVLPFLNFRKKDLRLRKDIVICLERAKIDPELLFYVDDLSQDGILGSDVIGDVVLLDHNAEQGSIARLLKENQSIRVSGIIDHHQDEKQHLDAVPRIIEKTGSCSSLVWDYWRETVTLRPEALGDREALTDVIELLSAPLVLDTTNCTSKMEKSPPFISLFYARIFVRKQ